MKKTALTILFVLMCAIPAHANITSRLVHHWTFDDGSGTTALDSVGSWNGTLSGSNLPTWTMTTKIGLYAVQMQSSNSYVVYSPPSGVFLGGGDWTVSFWSQKTGAGDQDPRAIMISGWSGDHIDYLDTCLNGHIYLSLSTFQAPSTINYYSQNLGTCPTNGVWHLWTITDASSNITLYEDGSVVGSPIAVVGNLYSQGDNANFGAYDSSGSFTFYGIEDDARIYSRALSSSDVAQLYAYHPPHGPNSFSTYVGQRFEVLSGNKLTIY